MNGMSRPYLVQEHIPSKVSWRETHWIGNALRKLMCKVTLKVSEKEAVRLRNVGHLRGVLACGMKGATHQMRSS